MLILRKLSFYGANQSSVLTGLPEVVVSSPAHAIPRRWRALQRQVVHECAGSQPNPRSFSQSRLREL